MANLGSRTHEVGDSIYMIETKRGSDTYRRVVPSFNGLKAALKAVEKRNRGYVGYSSKVYVLPRPRWLPVEMADIDKIDEVWDEEEITAAFEAIRSRYEQS